MTDQHRKPRSPGEAIYLAALDARQYSENLQPLLTLLDQGQSEDEPGPLDEMKGLLSAILTILARHSEILARLDDASPRLSPSSPSIETVPSGS